MPQDSRETSEIRNQEIAQSLLKKMNLEGVSDPNQQRVILEEAIKMVEQPAATVSSKVTDIEQRHGQNNPELSFNEMTQLMKLYLDRIMNLDKKYRQRSGK